MHICDANCGIRNSLHLLRSVAWQNTRKYQYDPVIGQIHEKYLDAINAIIEAEAKEHHHV